MIRQNYLCTLINEHFEVAMLGTNKMNKCSDKAAEKWPLSQKLAA